ncbi:MAG TPA: hypothetical protein PLD73_11280 [Candidatus Hydrogenedentes bacterium]|jgi:hypothetical protein|nr:hypothetical protein [Candidatus Hydrogenedentota bacterium]
MLDIYREIREAMRRDLDRAQTRGISAEIIADHFGLKKWSTYKWLEGESVPPLRVILAWPEVTGEFELARCIARHWGLTGARKLPIDAKGVGTSSLPATICECSEVFVAVGDALRDGQISKREAFRISREIAEAHLALEQLKEDVEASARDQRRASSLMEAKAGRKEESCARDF